MTLKTLSSIPFIYEEDPCLIDLENNTVWLRFLNFSACSPKIYIDRWKNICIASWTPHTHKIPQDETTNLIPVSFTWENPSPPLPPYRGKCVAAGSSQRMSPVSINFLGFQVGYLALQLVQKTHAMCSNQSEQTWCNFYKQYREASHVKLSSNLRSFSALGTGILVILTCYFVLFGSSRFMCLYVVIGQK